jgi:hypothetical protein
MGERIKVVRFKYKSLLGGGGGVDSAKHESETRIVKTQMAEPKMSMLYV